MESGRHASSASSAGTYGNLSDKAHEPPSSETCQTDRESGKGAGALPVSLQFSTKSWVRSTGRDVAIVEARNGVRHVAPAG
jgi:hypothetical protein